MPWKIGWTDPIPGPDPLGEDSDQSAFFRDGKHRAQRADVRSRLALGERAEPPYQHAQGALAEQVLGCRKVHGTPEKEVEPDRIEQRRVIRQDDGGAALLDYFRIDGIQPEVPDDEPAQQRGHEAVKNAVDQPDLLVPRRCAVGLDHRVQR